MAGGNSIGDASRGDADLQASASGLALDQIEAATQSAASTVQAAIYGGPVISVPLVVRYRLMSIGAGVLSVGWIAPCVAYLLQRMALEDLL